MTIWPFNTIRRLKADRDAWKAAYQRKTMQLAAAHLELAKPHPSTQAQHRAREAMRDYVNAELAGIAR